MIVLLLYKHKTPKKRIWGHCYEQGRVRLQQPLPNLPHNRMPLRQMDPKGKQGKC